LLQVMPLFFFVGGFANLASFQAVERHGGGAAEFIRGRLGRLARPVVAFLIVVVALDLVALAVVPGYESVWTWGRVVFVPLWFLGVYAGVVMLAPATIRLHRWGRELVVVGLGAAILLADLGRFRFGLDLLGLLNAGLVWVFCHQLGYFWRDGTLVRGDRRRLWALVVGGLAALVVLTNLGVYPRSMVAVRGEAISNMFPTTACIAALAVLQAGVVLLVRPTAERWLARRQVWKGVVSMNAVAMTLFTWHMTALVAFIALFQVAGGTLGDQPTASWWLTRPLWVVGPGLVLAGFVALFARIELPKH
jgi:hypothetical protein